MGSPAQAKTQQGVVIAIHAHRDFGNIGANLVEEGRHREGVAMTRLWVGADLVDELALGSRVEGFAGQARDASNSNVPPATARFWPTRTTRSQSAGRRANSA